MRKRLLASMIAMVLLLSLFPVSALAAERDKGSETPVACAVTEGCTLQAGHKCECVLPDEPETTEDDPAPADNVMSGNCGLYDYINKEYTDTVKWALTANDEDGYTLTIFGNGPMGNAYITEDNVSSGEPEWHYSREKITRVVIQDGVTSVGAKSFKNYTNLKTVVLPASITKIGQDSFYGSGITSITLPANLTTNLTTLYTKGTSTDHSITSFTAHFHAVQEGTAFSGTHLYNQTNSHLTADALKAIAPTELGVYSFVINGYSKDTKTYCYASRRYSIVMGNPKGEPTFDKVSSGVELSTITLSGSMKNAAGIEVAGTFSWDDGDQTLERGKSYAWTFTPDDTDHYNKATGTAVVWPSSSGGGSSSGRFTVSVDSGKNGSVTVSPKRAEKGDTVTITVKPNEGYELDKLVVTGKNGDEIKLTNEGGGKYTFKMPASSVEIEASFAKIEAEPKLPFADVSSGDWYYDAVVYVYKNGLMDGTGPAAFAPTTVLTRSMAAQVLWNLADSPAVPGTAGFTDVPSDAWYAGAVNWSASRGIVTGYSTGAFGPEDAVTREQLAAMLYRYAGTPEPTGSLDGFNDKDAVSDYAADALCWAVDEGLLTGKGGGWLDPAGTATRAEMAAILMRFTESHN